MNFWTGMLYYIGSPMQLGTGALPLVTENGLPALSNCIQQRERGGLPSPSFLRWWMGVSRAQKTPAVREEDKKDRDQRHGTLAPGTRNMAAERETRRRELEKVRCALDVLVTGWQAGG